MSKKTVADFVVIENTTLNASTYFIKLKASKPLPRMKPGQFVNVEIKNTDEIFLRRPFSIFEVDYLENTLSLIVKILGRGSKKLSEIKVGETLNLIFPLGKSFTYPESKEKILLIGGGSGIAPMLFLAKECGLQPENVDILIGARTSKDHINVDEYNKYGSLHFTTEDGSLGTKGFVTHHPVLKTNLKYFDKVYACGPEAMMKAIAKEAKVAGVFCEVSLENLMACGFGVCLCCIEPTVKGNLCVCTDGPVFNINELKW
ncbi:MAG: dihydroorotate dehydrogenase electron transfer subunit [Prolixibacteraceae bacterium]|jgi:dihydroorotate dehydrogenase electron transfer subunit|nr:dihydroorotate dehydrogenase electron transfer subunit [Prolixibacteraceae bacterium]MBT6005017.1 dihydroorotate dehydrogenase electron transfer subunit [Prolixibacteraceae bacterium]MBT6766391.1 dihydroorotate dehydrogenase electron transfer subunit [Prolixibacteraceae bacterium]MBT7000704.1 dihydroorotate dehydrogenase electron transfer subunit [Prolixibacteraceae bacterium]MBT7393612.1 dihydroorotate dehydrogenase electron transfer subunit [Prolixibacteraceae bacterium]